MSSHNLFKSIVLVRFVFVLCAQTWVADGDMAIEHVDFCPASYETAISAIHSVQQPYTHHRMNWRTGVWVKKREWTVAVTNGTVYMRHTERQHPSIFFVCFVCILTEYGITYAIHATDIYLPQSSSAVCIFFFFVSFGFYGAMTIVPLRNRTVLRRVKYKCIIVDSNRANG